MSGIPASSSAPAREAIRQRMLAIGAPEPSIESFLRQFDRLAGGYSGLLDRSSIAPPAEVLDASGLAGRGEEGRKVLEEAVMIKLNGGLGTSMGLESPKSLLPVKDGKTFLDVLAEQVVCLREAAGCAMPLVLMDSYATHEPTLSALAGHPELGEGQEDMPLAFVQHRVPKLRENDLCPIEWPEDPSLEWCPPGHGDLYLATTTSGILARLLDRGVQYAFVSNVDNLGAAMNLDILGYFAGEQLPFLMEVTDRTEADRKGGHLARLADGTLVLRESAQCPPDEEEEFQDVSKYRYFNTNNLWVNLRALDEHLRASGGIPDLPLIVNRKNVDPRKPDSPVVVQLETAMGAAISVFRGAQALRVPRERFAPVKTTDDLLALWSDAYVLTEDRHIRLHPDRKGEPVVISLDPRYYRSYHDFASRFPHGPPSLARCRSLAVQGDYVFERNVTIRGDVRLHHARPSQEVIREGLVLAGG